MAITNRVDFFHDRTVRAFVNESKSFNTASAGDVNSSFTVPAGKMWELRTLRAKHTDSVAREIEFILVEQDGTTHATLSNSGTGRNTVGPGATAAWDGSVFVPEGWTVRAQYYALASGTTANNWQYTAVETSLMVSPHALR
jgi:hypothetical protein